MKAAVRPLLALAAALADAAACGREPPPAGSVPAAPDDPTPEITSAAGSDVVIPAGDHEARPAGTWQRAAGAPQVVFSNFSDGTTTLTKVSVSGIDDATRNITYVCSTGSKGYPAWGGSEDRKRKIQEALQAMLADFNVVLTAKRPTEGPYTMIMVGPTGNGCSVGAAGIGPLDCENENPSNVAFNFSSQGDPITMAQELGHTFGLMHNDVACDVMGAGYSKKGCPSGGKWGYIDKDAPFVGEPGCKGSTQNSYQEMKRILGAWPGGAKPDPVGGAACEDKADPTVRIVEPADGATVASDFTVRGEAADDCALKEMSLEVPALGLRAMATASPFHWDVTRIGDADRLELVVTAQDGAGRKAVARVFVRVRGAGGGPAGGSGGSGAGGGGNGGGGGGGSTGPGGKNLGGGCSVGSSTPSPSAFDALFLAFVLGLQRRHRSGRAAPRP